MLIEWHNTILKNDCSEISGVLGIGENVTKRKRSDHIQRMIIRVLENLNQASDSESLMRHSLLLVRDLVECEAAGIRLRDGEDYPYFFVNGFTAEFVETEKTLCRRDSSEEIVRNSSGDPVLECICGTVISGKTDQAKPFFTNAGSFWTNSITRLLATTSKKERSFITRNRCMTKGYESIALIPLHSNGDIIGLLQLNDRRKNRFNPDIITLLEGITDSIGGALGKMLIEQSLRESEEKTRAIVDNIGIGISVISPGMEILSINNQMKTWFPDIDISDSPICYRTYKNPPQNAPCLYCPISKTLLDGEVHETISVTKCGNELRNYRIVSSPIKNKEGRIVAAIELIEDYSDKIMMEKALDERLQFEETLVSNISASLISIRPDHVDSALEEGLESIAAFFDADNVSLLYVDPDCREFQETHHWASGRFSSGSSGSGGSKRIFLPNLYSRLLYQNSLIYNSPEAIDEDLTEEIGFLIDRNHMKAGVIVKLTDTSEPLRLIMLGSMEEKPHWTGDIVQQLKFIGDIMVSAIDRKRVDRQLQETIGVAESANRAKSQFLANMSHEIRTPLNSIIGFADMIQETDLDVDQRDYVSTIKTSSEMLLLLLTDILDLSKIEAGELMLEETEFDPNRLAEDVCKMTRLRIGAKPIEVSCRLGEDLSTRLNGDPVRLRQVLTNLMDNAAKFTEKGKIELTLDMAEENDDRIKIHGIVTDSGIGIPHEHQQTIFELFQQGDKSMTRMFGGTGLGLPICRQIVHLMDGEIWIESEPDRGSSFHFTIWLTKVSEEYKERFEKTTSKGKKNNGPGTESDGRRGPSETTRILLVEDNPVNMKLAKLILARENFHVDIARNGREAVDMYTSAPDRTDMILMDVQMPVMDGIEATREIRARGHESVPIIAMTAHAINGDRERCLEAGMNDYITKPIRINRVLKTIAKWIAGKELV